jgi:6-phosphofructokinase
MSASSAPIRRIALSTGGGDAPGLNAAIRGVVLSALKRGWEVYGIRDGFDGLLFPERYAEGGLIRMTRQTVRGITHLGGTMLGTSNRNNPLRYPITLPDGKVQEVDRSDELVQAFRMHGLDALVTVGGDGSLTIAKALMEKGIRLVAVPKTIDNDLDKTDVTFGFDTAVAFATEALDRLHSTAASHGRVIVVEVMGRYAGWIALNSGVSGSADVILIPEIPYDIDKVIEKAVEHAAGRAERLGGIGEKVANEIQALSGKETRLVVLGHLLRGGTPTAFDRLIALRLGAAAPRALEDGQAGVMVALQSQRIQYVPILEALGRMKFVPVDCDTIQTARELGLSFGD